jgi:hypothetical protein
MSSTKPNKTLLQYIIGRFPQGLGLLLYNELGSLGGG